MRTLGLLTGILAAGLFIAPAGAADHSKKVRRESQDSDMQRAIEFQRNEDRAAARQARLEARHPSATYNNEANREQQKTLPGRKVGDPGPKVKK